MNSKDKDRLLILGYAVAAIVFFVGSIVFTRRVNPYWIAVFFLVAQQAYALPRVIKLYAGLYKQEISVRYVPLLGEAAIFSTYWGIVYRFLSGLCIFFGLVIVFPLIGVTFTTDIASALFGDLFAMNHTFYAGLALVISYIFLCLVRGFAFLEITRAVERVYKRNFRSDGVKGFFTATQHLMHFIPFVRLMSLLQLGDKLRKMLVFNNLVDDDENTSFSEDDLDDDNLIKT
jgi:hypothetical protein